MVIKSLFQLLTKDKLISFLMVLCVIFSSLVLNFSYGLYQNFHVLKKEQIEETYVMNYNIDADITKNELSEYALSLSREAHTLVSDWEIFLKKDGVEYYCPFSIYNGRISLSDDYVKDLMSAGWIIDGNFYSRIQAEKAEQVAVSHYSGTNAAIDFPEKDGTVEVMGKIYKVIGHQTITNAPSIPYNTVDDDVDVSKITILLNGRITKSIYEELKSKAANVFGDRVSLPRLRLPDESELYLYNTVMFIALVISIIAAMNFVVLYRYIFLKRKRNIAIFRMCGCTKMKAVLMYIAECMTIILPLYLLSVLAFHFIILPLFKETYIYMRGAYSVWVYAAISGIYIVSSIIILFIMMFKEINKNPVGAIRGGDNK